MASPARRAGTDVRAVGAWSRFAGGAAGLGPDAVLALACLDTTLSPMGGAPTYALTGNEKTLPVEHHRPVPVRHPDVVIAGRRPADPQAKGGAEATARIAS